MTRALWQRTHAFIAACRGQAMAEHASITLLMLGTGSFVLTQFLPGMVNGLNDYMHGFYFVLQLPLP